MREGMDGVENTMVPQTWNDRAWVTGRNVAQQTRTAIPHRRALQHKACLRGPKGKGVRVGALLSGHGSVLDTDIHGRKQHVGQRPFQRCRRVVIPTVSARSAAPGEAGGGAVGRSVAGSYGPIDEAGPHGHRQLSEEEMDEEQSPII